MEDCDLNDKEFKIVIFKTLDKIKENSENQLKKLRTEINE